ncbi:PDR/VanB family oxidoreductase [Actinoallomurus soli]|uniref:PDR/VanB family oxidoreductase n=1 Tax=Actinoallomurus soli TaxID=2952535 RepID=UPI0020938390|nr:PDR/VanB family oxidoreductase [Actinoallomurus soli]MCO5971282.1 PDR/VanB family oxidoreductase [Actinoallomurus soli]
MNDETEVVVAGRDRAADGVVRLTLRRPDGGPLPAWAPGAHVDLLLDGGGLIRQYSLCGSPEDRTAWRIAVLREPAGRGGSAYVHDQLPVGARLRVRGPRGNFPFRAAERYLFIAGGIGITPLLPMVAAADRAGARWRLLYGGRTRASMAFLDELAGYGDAVSVRPQDETGLLDLDAFLSEPDDRTLVYCCGPEPLLAAVEERCRTGWAPGALQVERFHPRETGTTVDAAFEVVLARSGRTLTVPAGGSVLETVRSAGVEVLYSCTEGTCGTCETDVLEGEPDHRDSVLTEEERAGGETMMICVSRSRGPRLVLDL